MNLLILALLLLSGTQNGFALALTEPHQKSCNCTNESNHLSEGDILARKDVDMFREIMKQSALNSLLVARTTMDSAGTRNLTFAPTFDVVHTQNPTLKQLLTDLELRNQLLIEHHINKGGAMDG